MMKREMKAISFVLILTIIMSLFIPLSVSAEESVSIVPGSLELVVGETATLDKTLTDIEPNRVSSVTWLSINSGIADVDANGVVTAKALGSTTIKIVVEYTATVEVSVPEGETPPEPDPESPSEPVTQEVTRTRSAECTVRVKSKPAATTAPTTVKKTTTKALTNYSGTVFVSLQAGKTAQLDTSGLGGGVKYESGNSSIVRVSSSGLITGVREGTTYIIAYNNTYQQ